MKFNELLNQARTRHSVDATSKKRALEEIAYVLADEDKTLDKDYVFEKLLERERLGSTGVGDGVAIPHCRLENCTEIKCILLTLEQSVDFEAIDDQPVDLICALVVPSDANTDHLTALSAIAENFGDKDFCAALRTAHSDEQLFELALAGLKAS